MLDLIAKLYRVVGGAERHGMRGPVRKRWVQCLLDAIKTWMLDAHLPHAMKRTRPLPTRG